MPGESTTTELALEILRAVALAALQEEQRRFALGQFTEHGTDFERLAGNALEEHLITKLNEGIGITNGRCIKLPERQKDGVWWAPLLWITAKDANEPDCDHLLQLVIGGTDRPFGFRWEPPEGGAGGEHDYWHAQPIISIRTIHNRELPLGLPRGATCTHAPTFPLHVDNRLSLIDALLVSLYGPSYLEEYVEDAHLRASILRNIQRGWDKKLAKSMAGGVKKLSRHFKKSR